MSEISELVRLERISRETRAIVEACALAPQPLVQLDDHARRLREDPHWPDRDAGEVLAAAQRILKAVVQAMGGNPDESTVIRQQD